jgi:pimeloyl-ACP methyl ester carboxylesterase
MPRIQFPADWPTDTWYGFPRHHFTVDGCKAWIVEPPLPAPDNRWSWCTQWAEAFVPRVGTVALLEHGFYHAHIDAFEFRGSPEGIAVMRRFQEKLIGMGLSPKANLIGMSWGGYLSLRYAAEHPEGVAAIYLDAPLCNAADDDTTPASIIHAARHNQEISERYGLSFDELKTSPLNPVNNLQPIVDAKIPVYAAVGEDDQVVNHATNFDVVERNFLAAGGVFWKVVRRSAWGHHPHGFDDVSELLDFHWRARETN